MTITETTDVIWMSGRQQSQSLSAYGRDLISAESSTAPALEVLMWSGTQKLYKLHIHHPPVPAVNP